MNRVDPATVVQNHEILLEDDGNWPNFHDAEVIDLYISRGDVRPDDNVYIFPKITTQIELCALEDPFVVTFIFEDCSSIEMKGFDHQNPIMDLHFGLEERGHFKNGKPLPPYIVVKFEPCLEFALSFRCFSITIPKVDFT